MFSKNELLKETYLLSKGRKLIFLKPDDILYVKANDNYSYLCFTNETGCMVCKSLAEIEKLLDGNSFIRCHRSYLVNLNHVKEIDKGRQYKLILSNGESVQVSRRVSSLFKRKSIWKSDKPIHPVKMPDHNTEVSIC